MKTDITFILHTDKEVEFALGVGNMSTETFYRQLISHYYTGLHNIVTMYQ